MNIGRVKIIVASLILLGVSACSPITKIEQPQIVDWVQLSEKQSIGQTFTARYDGLEGVEISIQPDVVEQGKVTLHLKNNPQDNDDVATSQISISRFSKYNQYKLKFTPQKQSFNHDYYVMLEVNGNSILSLGMASGDSYQNGALYQNNDPIDSQLSFNLIYNRKLALIGILYEILAWIKYMLIGVFLFIIPGWALLTSLYDQWAQKFWVVKIGLAAGLSLASYPIIFLWTNLIGLNMGAVYAWALPIFGLLVIVWRNRSCFSGFKVQNFHNLTIVDLTYISITGIIFAVRFWAIRNLPAPMWGDAFQHTVISQLLVDNQGLFNSWQPYAEISSFTYHFGFHSLVSVFHWISGLSLPQATLWTGQILNGLAVLCLVPLVMKITNNAWGGVFSITLAGLFFQMPMYYLNWGRYTQLAGQIILIACVYLAWETLENSNKKWQIILINCLVLAGLALTHYRVLIFAICFYLAYILIHLKFQFKYTIINTIIIGAGSLVIFSPWLFHIFIGKIPLILASKFSLPTNQIASPAVASDPIGDISFYLHAIIWIFFLVVFLWGLWRRNRQITWFGVWWLVILLATNPQWLGLPGTGAITNFAVFIAAYIPAGIILGGIFGIIIDVLPKYFEKYFTPRPWVKRYQLPSLVLAITLLIFSGVSGRQLLNLIKPDVFALLTRPDIKAMQWIKLNTSPEAKFLVNSFLAYNNTTSVGSDGGWWLQYLTLRPSTLPPINYGSETNPTADFTESIKNLTATIQENGITSSEAWDLLMKNGVNYVYIGQKQGRVNYSGPVIDPFVISQDDRFHEVYHADRVWIFEVVK